MKTFILKWNPAISSINLMDMQMSMAYIADNIDSAFNWSVFEWEKVEKGDRIFMLKVGRGKTGIIGSGWFSTEPYEGEDWNGSENPRHYADIVWDVMIFPQRNPILTTKELQAAIPSLDWKGGHSGVVISEENATLLENLWKAFITKNNTIFNIDYNNAFESLIGRAYGIALNAHKGQLDKAGKDYFTAHVLPVHRMCEELYDEDDLCVSKIVALLHDVVEDTEWTFEMLKEQGFTDRIIETLKCVTKQDGEEYDHYISRVLPNDFARAVKIADLRSNMDVTRLDEITEKVITRLRKYLKAYHRIMEVEENS